MLYQGRFSRLVEWRQEFFGHHELRQGQEKRLCECLPLKEGCLSSQDHSQVSQSVVPFDVLWIDKENSFR